MKNDRRTTRFLLRHPRMLFRLVAMFNAAPESAFDSRRRHDVMGAITPAYSILRMPDGDKKRAMVAKFLEV